MAARDQYLAEHWASIDPSIIAEWEAYKSDHWDDANNDIECEIGLKLGIPAASIRW